MKIYSRSGSDVFPSLVVGMVLSFLFMLLLQIIFGGRPGVETLPLGFVLHVALCSLVLIPSYFAKKLFVGTLLAFLLLVGFVSLRVIGVQGPLLTIVCSVLYCPTGVVVASWIFWKSLQMTSQMKATLGAG